MSIPPSNTLSRQQRLKSRSAIQDLFAGSEAFTAYPIRVVYKWLPQVAEPGVKVGMAVSTRHFKRAYDRNRIKRLLRECYRLQQHELQAIAKEKCSALHVFFMYVDKVLPTYAPLYDKMRYCLKRLRKMQEGET